MQYVNRPNLTRWLGFGVALWALGLAGCGEDEGSGGGGDGGTGTVPTYAQVAAIMGTDGAGQSSCSLSTCHGAGVADFTLEAGTDLLSFVGTPACEAPSLSLIVPGDPENSWLYIKLAGEIEDPTSGDLVPQPSWGQPSTSCPNTAGFGKRMPRVAPYTLPQEELTVVYEWIKGGAPGPM